MASLFKALIRGYTFLVSPLLGQNCRFHPTCSAYTCQALDKHGAAKGLALGAKRLCKCHPWHHGDFHDPVPGSIAWGQIIGYKRPDLNDSLKKKEARDARP